jgi:SM-20-related protein
MSEIADIPSAIIDTLARQGWCVWPDFLAPAHVEALRAVCHARYAAGSFHRAGIGSGSSKVMNEVRGDAILWVEEGAAEPPVRDYLTAMEALRASANRELYLGLYHLEAHFAAYPPGAFYRRHLDRFRDDDRRTLTAIVYLNQDWRAEDGGMLRFWPDLDGTGEPLEILPAGGTLVTFLSERYWHEVLPARRERLALTGWFKRR